MFKEHAVINGIIHAIKFLLFPIRILNEILIIYKLSVSEEKE